MKNLYSKVKNREAISVYYIGNFLSDFAMALQFAIYGLFLYKSGLNLLQVNLINVTYMISIFLLEVPTGAFADALGRRRSVLLGLFIMVIGLAIYPIHRSFRVFMFAEILLAAASTFISGAWDAWMVDTSNNQNFTGKVDNVFSQSHIISRFALIFGGLTGGYLASVALELPFYMGSLVALIAFIFLLFFMEGENHKIDFSLRKNFHKMYSIAYDSIKYSMGHKVIFWLLLGGIISTLASQPLNMFWNIRFNNMLGDNNIWLMGWLWALMSIFMIIGAYLVKHFLNKGKDYTFLMILASLGIFVPILVSATQKTFLLAFSPFLIHQLARGIIKPVDQAFLNKYAESDKRATILSFDSMVSGLGAAVGLVFFGWIAKNNSIETSWIIAAFLTLAMIPIYLMARKKETHYGL